MRLSAQAALLDRPHEDLRRALATGAPVFLPVNPVEYHGPHLSLHNDALLSRALAREVHGALAREHADWPFLLASDLEVGVEPVPGPGSRAVAFATVRSLVVDACRRLADLGARGVVLATFHGSPLHNLALEAGVRELAKRGVRAIAPLHLLLDEMIRGDVESWKRDGLGQAVAHVPDGVERERMMRELPLDFHAGFFETSMALRYAPDSVSPVHRTLAPCPSFCPTPRALLASRMAERLRRPRLARELRFAAHALAWHSLRPFPGYTGRPHLATADAGEVFGARIVRQFATAVAGVLGGRDRPPPPVMAWIATATFGGRLDLGRLPTSSAACNGS